MLKCPHCGSEGLSKDPTMPKVDNYFYDTYLCVNCTRRGWMMVGSNNYRMAKCGTHGLMRGPLPYPWKANNVFEMREEWLAFTNNGGRYVLRKGDILTYRGCTMRDPVVGNNRFVRVFEHNGNVEVYINYHYVADLMTQVHHH
jgi:hypothetical protein